MKKSVKYIVGVTAVAFLVVAGLFLPVQLAAGSDQKILGQVQSQPLDQAELSDYVNVSMVDKVSLLGQAKGTSLVPLKTGSNYDQDTVKVKFFEELERLYELGFFPLPVTGEYKSFNPGVTLYIQNDAPSISMILWEINFRVEGLTATFFMDDQTGKILSFDMRAGTYNDCIYTQDMAEAWAVYLGTEVKNIGKAPEGLEAEKQEGIRKIDQQDIYTFELSSGPRSIGGQFYSLIQATGSNRWVLNYPRANYEYAAAFNDVKIS